MSKARGTSIHLPHMLLRTELESQCQQDGESEGLGDHLLQAGTLNMSMCETPLAAPGRERLFLWVMDRLHSREDVMILFPAPGAHGYQDLEEAFIGSKLWSIMLLKGGKKSPASWPPVQSEESQWRVKTGWKFPAALSWPLSFPQTCSSPSPMSRIHCSPFPSLPSSNLSSPAQVEWPFSYLVTNTSSLAHHLPNTLWTWGKDMVKTFSTSAPNFLKVVGNYPPTHTHTSMLVASIMS